MSTNIILVLMNTFSSDYESNCFLPSNYIDVALKVF